MPNQRSPNKVRLGGFIDRQLHRQIMTLARREGMTDDKFGFARKLIEEALARRAKAKRRVSRRVTKPGAKR